MGEAYTALHDPLAGMMYNPASVASEQGSSLFQSWRQYFGSKSWDYKTTAAAIKTPYGNFGILYSRFDLKEISFLEYYDYSIGITFSKYVSNNIALGASLKTYNHIENYNIEYYTWNRETITQPILLDLGFLYEQPFSSGKVSCGISLQNFGTDLIQRSKYYYSSENILLLPRYIRTGLAYSLTPAASSENDLTPYSFTCTAEYRNLLNAPASWKSDRDTWGIGIELSYLEILNIRGGAYSSPFESVYGEKGKFAIRYGAGLYIPFEKIGVQIPFKLNVDYAAVQLNNFDENSPVNVLTVQLHYTNELF